MVTATLEISTDRETMQPRILIADDQQDVLDALRLLLKGHGFTIETVNSPADLLAAVARQKFDILLIDLNYARDTTSGREGLDVLSRLKEIDEAKAIQEKLLPRDIPQLPGYKIASAWQSARLVGGDYFDILPLDEKTLGICIADVAGKGMPAALLMSNLQAAVRGLSSPSLAPSLLCSRLNSIVYRNTDSDRFITFFYAHLDGPTRRLAYVNAGHNAPFVVRSDGSHERLREGGAVLGVFASRNYEMGSAQLFPGDRVILFTDGVTEACSPAGEEVGESRLLRLLEDPRALSAAELQAKILAVTSEFSGGRWQDDATLLVLAVGE